MVADLSHPIYGLAQGCLAHPRALLGPAITRVYRDHACGFAGAGLDHVVAERPLAFGDDTGGGALRHYFLLTDRRILGRAEDRPFSLTHLEAGQVVFRPGVTLEVVHARGRQRLAFPSFAEGLARFFHTLGAQPPAARTPPPEPLVTPRQDDPAGAWLACGRLADDARGSVIARIVAEKVARSEVPADVGADLVARIVLHSRVAQHGPAMREGWWLSALGARDVLFALAALLGPPTGQQAQGPVLQLLHGPPAVAPGAAGSLPPAPGIAALTAPGQGWAAAAPGALVRGIRVSLRETPSSASLAFEATTGGPPGPLTLVAPQLQTVLLAALADLEAHLLLCRAIYGWTLPPDQLAAIPRADLVSNASAVVGEIDPELFFPPTE